VSVAKGQTAQVTINLKREISVNGKVTTLDGSALTGCRIEWVGSQNPWTDSATSQQDGSFWLTNLPGGPGRLLLWSSEDAAKLPVAWLDVLPGPDAVALKFDPETPNGRIVLEPILPDGIDRGSVEVRIFQEEGASMDRVCIGHSGDTTDLDYLESLLRAGVYVSLARYPGRAPRATWQQRNEVLKALQG